MGASRATLTRIEGAGAGVALFTCDRLIGAVGDQLYVVDAIDHAVMEAKLEAAEAEITRLREFEWMYKDLCK